MKPNSNQYPYEEQNDQDQIIVTIANRNNPSQVISIKYLRSQSAFCTSGVQSILGTKEILVPVYLVAKDFQLIGTIISAILERISQAGESGATFVYQKRFEVLGRQFTLTEEGEYVKLEEEPR